jgi:hypothetical protein
MSKSIQNAIANASVNSTKELRSPRPANACMNSIAEMPGAPL